MSDNIPLEKAMLHCALISFFYGSEQSDLFLKFVTFFDSNCDEEDIAKLTPDERILALQFACSKRLSHFIKCLVLAKTSCDGRAFLSLSRQRLPPLLSSLHNNDTESALFLLKHGYCVRVCTKPGEFPERYQSAMHLAIFKKNIDVIKALLTNRIKLQRMMSHTPSTCLLWLKYAIQRQVPLMLFAPLWKQDPSWVSGSFTKTDTSPLMDLIFYLSRTESNTHMPVDYVLQSLDDLKSIGFGPTWDSEPIYPFKYLARSAHYNGWKQVADKLIEIGFNPLEVNDRGINALHIAMKRQHFEFVDYLSNIDTIAISSIDYCIDDDIVIFSPFSNKHL
jgi:hypothetical protein